MRPDGVCSDPHGRDFNSVPWFKTRDVAGVGSLVGLATSRDSGGFLRVYRFLRRLRRPSVPPITVPPTSSVSSAPGSG